MLTALSHCQLVWQTMIETIELCTRAQVHSRCVTSESSPSSRFLSFGSSTFHVSPSCSSGERDKNANFISASH